MLFSSSSSSSPELPSSPNPIRTEHPKFSDSEGRMHEASNQNKDMQERIGEDIQISRSQNCLMLILIFNTHLKKNNFAYYWVPLICLFSGCRINEICSLYLDNVIKKKGKDKG